MESESPVPRSSAGVPEQCHFDVFISYRRTDGGKAARWLRAWLRNYRLPRAVQERLPEGHFIRQPIEVFIDEPYSRGAADYYDETIRPALLDSRFLLVIASPTSLLPKVDGTPNWVEREIGDFLETPRREDIIAVATREFADDPAQVNQLPGGLLGIFPRLQVICLGRLSPFRLLWWRWMWRPRDAALSCVAAVHAIPSELMPLLRNEDLRIRTRRVAGVAVAMLATGALIGGAHLSKRAAERREMVNLIRTSGEFISGLKEGGDLNDLADRYQAHRSGVEEMVERKGIARSSSDLIATLVRLNLEILMQQAIGVGRLKTPELSGKTLTLINELRRRESVDLEFIELELRYHEQRLFEAESQPGGLNADSLGVCERNLKLLEAAGPPRNADGWVRELRIRTCGIDSRQMSNATDLRSWMETAADAARKAEATIGTDSQVMEQCAVLHARVAGVKGGVGDIQGALDSLEDTRRTATAANDGPTLATMLRQRSRLHAFTGANARATEDAEECIAVMKKNLEAPVKSSGFAPMDLLNAGIAQINRATLILDYLNLCQLLAVASQPPDLRRIATALGEAEKLHEEFLAHPVPPNLKELPESRLQMFRGQLAWMQNRLDDAAGCFAKGSSAGRANWAIIQSPGLLENILTCENSLFQLALHGRKFHEAERWLEGMQNLASQIPGHFPAVVRESVEPYNDWRQAGLYLAKGDPAAAATHYKATILKMEKLCRDFPGNFQFVNDRVMTVLQGGELVVATEPGIVAEWCNSSIRMLGIVPDSARNQAWQWQSGQLRSLLEKAGDPLR